jgi:WD40 repeat protein
MKHGYRLRWFLCIIAGFNYVDGMESMISVRLSDDEDKEVKLSKKELQESVTLRDMFEDMDEKNPIIPIPFCSKKLWEDFIAIALKKLADAKSLDSDGRINLMVDLIRSKSTNTDVYIEIINASNYLHIPDLLAGAIKTFAHYLKNNSDTLLKEPELLGKINNMLPDMQTLLSSYFLSYYPIVARLHEPLAMFSSLAFNLSGTKFAAGSYASKTTVWNMTDPSNPKPDITLEELPDVDTRIMSGSTWSIVRPSSVTAIAFIGDDIIASGSYGKIKLWDTKNFDLKPKNILTFPLKGSSSIVFNNVRQLLAVGLSIDGELIGRDDELKAINRTGSPLTIVWQVQALNNPVEKVHVNLAQKADESIKVIAFNPQGTLLASVSNKKNEIILWDLEDLLHPKKRAAITTGKQQLDIIVRSLIFNTSGTILVSLSYDGNVLLCDVTNPNNPQLLARIDTSKDQGKKIRSITIHPSGTIMACGLNDGTIQLYDITNPSSLQQIAVMDEFDSSKGSQRHPVNELIFNPAGTILASQMRGDMIDFFEIQPLSLQQKIFLYCLRKHFKTKKNKFVIKKSTILDTIAESFSTSFKKKIQEWAQFSILINPEPSVPTRSTELLLAKDLDTLAQSLLRLKAVL